MAVTVDGPNDSARFDINGVQNNAGVIDPNFGATNTSPLYIGSRADQLTAFGVPEPSALVLSGPGLPACARRRRSQG